MRAFESADTVLIVCTANVCRSPIAAALLTSRFSRQEVELNVSSAGLHAVGGPADELARRVLASQDIDISRHFSTGLTEQDIVDAALVLAMERSHVAEIAALVPGAFAKTFGLTEIVALGARHGPRGPNESIGTWIARISADRRPEDVLQARAGFDIADPHGGDITDYERCVELLTQLAEAVAELLTGPDDERRGQPVAQVG